MNALICWFSLGSNLSSDGVSGVYIVSTPVGTSLAAVYSVVVEGTDGASKAVLMET